MTRWSICFRPATSVTRLDDPVGIAAAGIARVDQHRFAGGRDQQRRRAAFDVDPVEIEPLVGRAGEGGRSEQDEKRCRTQRDADVAAQSW